MGTVVCRYGQQLLLRILQEQIEGTEHASERTRDTLQVFSPPCSPSLFILCRMGRGQMRIFFTL